MALHIFTKVVGTSLFATGVAHYLYLLDSHEKLTLATIGIGCATACYWYSHRHEKEKQRIIINQQGKYDSKTNSAPETFVEVIFFPDRITIDSEMSTASREMRGMMYKNILYENATKEGAGLHKLRSYLTRAIKTVDVCLFNITSEQLTKYVTDTIDRGVKVRLIVDGSTFESSGSQVKNFLAAGAFVRSSWKLVPGGTKSTGNNGTTNGDYLMHHKFAVIDQSILITGSFNWTMQALMGNNENIIITSEPEIVGPFVAEFENLWKQFDPK